jgi:hypothetical protein
LYDHQKKEVAGRAFWMIIKTKGIGKLVNGGAGGLKRGKHKEW